jgi:hypothetical protein
MVSLVVVGIWVGAHYFFKTRTVFVFKELQQEDVKEENDQFLDNRIQDGHFSHESIARSESESIVVHIEK